MPAHCEIIEVRNSADVVGYLCSGAASKECSDCGIQLCESHTERCGICHSIFLSFLLILSFGAAFQSCLSRPRASSATTNRLNLVF